MKEDKRAEKRKLKKAELINYEQELDEEVRRRLSAMEDPDYEFPHRFSKFNYFVVAIVVLLSLGLIVYGSQI